MPDTAPKGPLLHEVPFTPSIENLFAATGLQKSPASLREKALSLISEGEKIARPRLLYRDCSVSVSPEGDIRLNTIPLEGELPRKNLKECSEAVAFIATCGIEIHRWLDTFTDYLEISIAAVVADAALQEAVNFLFTLFRKEGREKPLSIMTPGSLPGWPFSDQEKIYSLLEKKTGEAEISLTREGLLIPLKSISGILFSGVEEFISCRSCTIEGCRWRRATFQTR